VALSDLKLNPALVRCLRGWAGRVEQGEALPAAPEPSSVYVKPNLRASARLTEVQVASIIERFQAGTAKHELADEYGVSLSTV